MRRVFWALMLVAVGSVSVPTALAGTSCGWSEVAFSETAHPSLPFAVDATSPKDAWAVGVRATADLRRRAISWHWDGATWSKVPVPKLRAGAQGLRAVDAVAPDDVWAVGLHGRQGQPMIVRWNGSRWRHSPGPSFAHGIDLLGVAAVAPDRAWAVGSTGAGGVVLRWNGVRWDRVAVPFHEARSPWFTSVAAVSRHDVWVVGTVREPGTDPVLGIAHNPVAMHWDGSSWTKVHVPHASAFPESLAAVEARASDDAWAVGTTSDENAMTNPGLIYRWNGIRWSRSPYTFVGTGQNRLTSVSASAADAAWITGSDSGGSGEPFVLVWDGATWATDTLPALPGDVGILTDVMVSPSGEGWVTGAYWSADVGGPEGTWVLHRTC